MAKKDREIKAWITINGKHVPIFEGESKTDAVKRATSKTDTQKQIDKDQDDKEKQIARNKKEKDDRNKKERFLTNSSGSKIVSGKVNGKTPKQYVREARNTIKKASGTSRNPFMDMKSLESVYKQVNKDFKSGAIPQSVYEEIYNEFPKAFFRSRKKK